jgi:predicted RNase H-like nuclease (RuvC/YqgF family)
MQAMVEARSKAIADAHAEYEKVQESIARARADGGGEAGGATAHTDFSALGGTELEQRARALEEEKLRLEREKIALERGMREMTATTQALRSDLSSAEQQRARLEGQLRDMSSEDTELSAERQMRKRLERKLQIAEDSLKRLDHALRKSGVKLDIDVFADVKTLMTFFEER